MQIIVPLPPLRGKRPSALLCADKPAVVATDAIIPRRPPNLGGEFNECFLISNSRYLIDSTKFVHVVQSLYLCILIMLQALSKYKIEYRTIVTLALPIIIGQLGGIITGLMARRLFLPMPYADWQMSSPSCGYPSSPISL